MFTEYRYSMEKVTIPLSQIARRFFSSSFFNLFLFPWNDCRVALSDEYFIFVSGDKEARQRMEKSNRRGRHLSALG